MTFKYKKESVIIMGSFFACLTLILGIKNIFFSATDIDEPIKSVISYYNDDIYKPKLAQATTEVSKKSNNPLSNIITNVVEEDMEKIKDEVAAFPYYEAPSFEDDGSIIYDGLTITELTNKLNKSLNSYLTNTGYFFANYTRRTGLNPYLSVAIVLLETGCKWKCSTLTIECNNIGGLKGHNSCNGRSYSKYDTLDEGISSYLDIIYNNYYLKGLDTPEKMASKYAASSEWANKVNAYITEIKSK